MAHTTNAAVAKAKARADAAVARGEVPAAIRPQVERAVTEKIKSLMGECKHFGIDWDKCVTQARVDLSS